MKPFIILLTGTFEAQLLTPLLKSDRGSLIQIQSLDQWPKEADPAHIPVRLIAFCTAVIVPAALLARLPGPSYNVHPGPPCYPGRHPESWAAYDGATRFGATLHEMAPRVDEGAIIDVKWVDAPPDGGQLEYGMLSFRASIDLVARWRDRLLDVTAPLPRLPDTHWSGHKTTHAEGDAMCRIDVAIDESELARRQRAFAQVPGSQISLTLHGRTFIHTVPPKPAAG